MVWKKHQRMFLGSMPWGSIPAPAWDLPIPRGQLSPDGRGSSASPAPSFWGRPQPRSPVPCCSPPPGDLTEIEIGAGPCFWGACKGPKVVEMAWKSGELSPESVGWEIRSNCGELEVQISSIECCRGSFQRLWISRWVWWQCWGCLGHEK